MSKKSKTEQTPEQLAFLDVTKAKLADALGRWAPLQKRAAEQIDAMGAKDSFARESATGKAAVDSAVRFGSAQEKLNEAAGVTGSFGSSGHKLALAGLGSDQAASRAIGNVRADQAVDDARISGLETVTAMARGQEKGALQGMGRSAALSGQEAAADAEMSLQNRIGWANLAGRAGGFALGNARQQPTGFQDEPGLYTNGGGLRP